jgi:hypothetical protein
MHKILLSKWKHIFKILNFFSLHFQLRSQFYVGRSSWMAWHVSVICLVVVFPKACFITTQTYITPFAYHWNNSGDTLFHTHIQHLIVKEGIGQCFLPRSSNLMSWGAAERSLPTGLCTFRSCPVCANKFQIRVFWKSLCEIFLPPNEEKRI